MAWLDGAPDLRGQVTLVRWWTNGCSMCSESAPVLAELSRKASVVAIYHPKPPRDVAPETVRRAAESIGMPGALGVDRDWRVLERWKGGKTWSYTSLTFLLDRSGRVRYVHPGGTITEADGRELGQRIDALRAE